MKSKAKGGLIGIDIGNNAVCMAQIDGAQGRAKVARLPENLVREEEVIAPESLGSFLKEMHDKGGFTGKKCVLILPEDNTYFRTVTMPPISDAQLKLNLPYEFRDYVGNEGAAYNYDYAVREIVRDDEGKPIEVRLFAAAARRDMVNEFAQILRKAGLRIAAAIPREMALIQLLKYADEQNAAAPATDVPAALNAAAPAKDAPAVLNAAAPATDAIAVSETPAVWDADEPNATAQTTREDEEYCLVEIDYDHTHIDIARGRNLTASKTVDLGCRMVDEAIAGVYNIDTYLAATYRETNYENVLDDPACHAVYERISLEITKAVNFYRYENQESALNSVKFCGIGSSVPMLTAHIANYAQLEESSVLTLLPPQVRGVYDASMCATAIGAVL